ncbi:hypothetical protein QYM36_002502 [Artemia franciscana]|uniref:UBC core domain-containing protein n=1 Tax=Artemia franciscana TaxID=6661 RepID=A0AA88I311_ARTSF|nr:hypothetical protein QYM36_002502 [Artemia franciscana]
MNGKRMTLDDRKYEIKHQGRLITSDFLKADIFANTFMKKPLDSILPNPPVCVLPSVAQHKKSLMLPFSLSELQTAIEKCNLNSAPGYDEIHIKWLIETPDIFQAKLLEVLIAGLIGTPYQGGKFDIEITIPERYPFEAPGVRFTTPVYHPNIDNRGRICMDLLKSQPTGTWKPTIHLSHLLISVQLLLSEPNPNDPLMPEIAEEFLKNREKFNATARSWTAEHATKSILRMDIFQERFEPRASSGECSERCDNAAIAGKA